LFEFLTKKIQKEKGFPFEKYSVLLRHYKMQNSLLLSLSIVVVIIIVVVVGGTPIYAVIN